MFSRVLSYKTSMELHKYFIRCINKKINIYLKELNRSGNIYFFVSKIIDSIRRRYFTQQTVVKFNITIESRLSSLTFSVISSKVINKIKRTFTNNLRRRESHHSGNLYFLIYYLMNKNIFKEKSTL